MKGDWLARKTLPVAGFALLTLGLSTALSPSAVSVVGTAYADAARPGASTDDATASQAPGGGFGRGVTTPEELAAAVERGSRALSSVLVPVGPPKAVEKALEVSSAAAALADLSGPAPGDGGQDASREAIGFEIIGPLSSAPNSRLMHQYGITSQSPSEVRASGEALALAPSADVPRRSR